MEAQGVGGWFDSNHNPVANGSSAAGDIFLPINRVVETIDIPALSAQAGQIFIFADQIEGSGILDAPATANVNIINTTGATPNIEGITIPQLIGGVYANGVILSASTLAGDITAINTGNTSAANHDNQDPQSNTDTEVAASANFSNITLAAQPTPPSQPGTGQPSTAFITITNQTPHAPTGPGAPTVTFGSAPDIIISGDINAIEADLTVTSQNNIDITAQLIDVNAQTFSAKNDISISTIVFNAAGNPASQLLPTGNTSLDAIGDTADGPTIIGENPSLGSTPTASESYIETYEHAVQQSTLLAQTISIDAEYVNLNGTITAGSYTDTLTINQSDIQDQINTITSEGLSGITPLSLPNGDDPNGEFDVGYNPANGGSLVVADLTLAGGIINIKGKVYSTSQASLNAFGYYGDVTINNNTNINLVVNNINVAQPGAGIISITDYNQTQASTGTAAWTGSGNDVLETTYQSVQGQTMQIQKQWVNGTTGALDKLAPTYQLGTAGASTQYQPEVGQRYEFSVIYGTQTTVTRTYHSSNWVGTFHIGSGTNYSSNTVVTDQPQILASSERFYLDTHTGDPSTAYIYTTQTNVASSTGFTAGANWSTSTWYGKTTYYQQTVNVINEQTVSTDSIRADLAIDINFQGYASSGINITSGGNVTILGNLSNLTGTTSITAGGTITQPNSGGSAASTIEGVQVSLTAAAGIGTKSQPVNVVLVGSVGESLTAATTNGAIYINAPQSGLAINTVLAGGDQAVVLSANGAITTATGSTGLITGGNVSLTAVGAGIGSSSNYLQLDVGQANGDQLNVSAGGDVFLEQESGNLPLFALTTGGNATIVVDDGSLVNVNTNVQVDPRTVAELEAGLFNELQLTTATGAEAKIQSALTEYQLSQQQDYVEFWNDFNLLTQNGLSTNPADGALIPLSASDNQYYTQLYETQYNTTNPNDPRVLAAIAAIENSNTSQYANLYGIFGPGGTYNPSGANTYDPATESNITITSSLTGITTPTQVIYGNVSGKGTLTLTNSETWASLGYVVGQGIYINSSTDPNSNGATFNAGAANAFYTIASMSGGVLTLSTALTVDAQTTVSISPVAINAQNASNSTLQAVATAAQVSFGNAAGAGTITLTNGASWAALGYTVGQGIFVGSSTDANANGASFSASASHPYYTVASINGSILTLQTGQTFTAESNVTVNLAPVAISLQDNSTVNPAVIPTAVNFSNVAGTITLSGNGNWNTLGYTVGEGIYVQGTGANGNGAAFNPLSTNPYYTIAAISNGGSTITLVGGEPLTAGANQTVSIAAVTIDAQNASNDVLVGSPTSTQVTFGNTAGTITLAGGGSWAALGYTVGQGIFVGSSTDGNANGATFNAGAANPYYTIAAINGSVITLQAGQTFTAETGATVNLAPVAINTQNPANSILQPTVTVAFGNANNAGTITLTDGGSWAALGFSVGQGIFVSSSTNANANGTTFNVGAANPYYTIAAINGSVITLEAGETLTPVTNISTLVAAPVSTQVAFGNSGGAGTITLTGGGSWAGYSVGQGIFVGSSTDINANGTTFSASAANPYYTIAAINGNVVTLQTGQTLTTEASATVNLAAVNIAVQTVATVNVSRVAINIQNNSTLVPVAVPTGSHLPEFRQCGHHHARRTAATGRRSAIQSDRASMSVRRPTRTATAFRSTRVHRTPTTRSPPSTAA